MSFDLCDATRLALAHTAVAATQPMPSPALISAESFADTFSASQTQCCSVRGEEGSPQAVHWPELPALDHGDDACDADRRERTRVNRGMSEGVWQGRLVQPSWCGYRTVPCYQEHGLKRHTPLITIASTDCSRVTKRLISGRLGLSARCTHVAKHAHAWSRPIRRIRWFLAVISVITAREE